MGQDNPAVKPLLLAFGEGAVFKKLPDDVVIPVWLFDHTSHSKFLPTIFDTKTKSKVCAATGYEFLMECFLRKPINAFLKKAIIVYVCLDRGSPVNKSIEHETRYANVKPMKTPPNYFNSPALLNDYAMPNNVKTNDEWKTFIGNPQLYRRMVHYMTMRMIGTRGEIDEELQKYARELSNDDYNDDLEDFTVDYRNEKTLFLHGGRLRKPDPDRPRFYKFPDPFLLEFKTVTTEIASTSTSRRTAAGRYDIKRSVKINRAYDPTVINNLLEGEVAALFYAQAHIERGDNVMIITPDMDVLMMLLLSCPDRINPITGKFVCRVFVQLVVSTPGYTRFVDVHQLWYNIHSTRPLKRMGSPGSGPPLRYKSRTSNEYVSKICSMCLLCGTDYVKNYCLGITNKKGSFGEELLDILVGKKNVHDKKTTAIRKKLEALSLMPWIVYTFLTHYEEFEDMITISRDQEYDFSTKLRASAKVNIDEEAFIRFTRRVYTEHYTASSVHKKQFEEKYGEDRSVKNVKKFLNEDRIEKLQERLAAQKRQEERLKQPYAKIPKNIIAVDEAKAMTTIKRNRLPPPRKIRINCRHLLWQLEYMLNGYKFNCTVIDPTTLYLELPYYGWFLSSGKCKAASRVSLKRPNVEASKKTRVMNRRFVTLQATAAAAEMVSASSNEDSDSDVEEKK